MSSTFPKVMSMLFAPAFLNPFCIPDTPSYVSSPNPVSQAESTTKFKWERFIFAISSAVNMPSSELLVVLTNVELAPARSNPERRRLA